MNFNWNSCLGALVGFIILLNAVSAKGPPRVISQVTQRQIARVGDTVRLSCPVEADPPPLLQWTKDGESIHRGWERFRTMSLALRIKLAEVEDTGKYQCKATNGFGHVTVDYVLIVLQANQSEPSPEEELPVDEHEYEAPRFKNPDSMNPSHIVRLLGSTVRLHCRAHGLPRPVIHWYKDGIYFDFDSLQTRLNSGNARIKEYQYYDGWEETATDIEADIWTIRLPNLVAEDSGEYKCVVSNSYGEIEHTYTLEIVDDDNPKPILIPPNPRNTTVNYGETASFMCEVRSLDQPHIQWLKRVDGPLNSIKNNTIKVNGQQFVVLQAGEVLSRNDGSFLNKLTITHATERDSGMYICLGANVQGYNVRSAFLTVIPPDPRYHPEQQVIPQNSSFWDNRALPIIIGVPAGVILIIIAVIVCVVKRKQNADREIRGTNHIVRTPQRYPVGQNAFTPQSEKMLDHQYAALHPQTYPVQEATSQERIVKTYSDKHSDSSYQCPMQPNHNGGTPPLPPLTPTPTLVQQHTHMHYYPRT